MSFEYVLKQLLSLEAETGYTVRAQRSGKFPGWLLGQLRQHGYLELVPHHTGTARRVSALGRRRVI